MTASRVVPITLLIVAGTQACAGSGEYTCPDPVGKIIRDDCEVYRTKYEALRVELGASFMGLVGAKTALGQSGLRDPSELIQVLAHRTHALCKDFNACRVPPLEYRQRREQTDRIFTAVSTVQEQLKQSNLDAESKSKLVRELVRVLSEDAPVTLPASATSIASKSAARPTRRLGAYHSWLPWYGTKLLPPLPRSPAGFPILADARYSLEHVFRQKSPYGVMGYRVRARFYLHGHVESDDMVMVDWGGQTSDCPIGHGEENGLAVVRCDPPKAQVLTAPSFTIKVSYRRGADGKTAVIGQRSVPVRSRQDEEARPGSLTYALDLDGSVRHGRVVFRPYDGLPPELEQPTLSVVLKVRKHVESTARCWVNGQPATPGLPQRGGGQEGMFQDRPRYRKVEPHGSEAVREPHVFWWRYNFELPFVLRRGSSPVPDGLRPWPVVGNWRCVISVEGDPIRELTFRVGADGRPSVHPRQLEQPEAGWLVETKLLQNPVEVPIP